MSVCHTMNKEKERPWEVAAKRGANTLSGEHKTDTRLRTLAPPGVKSLEYKTSGREIEA